MLLLVCFFGALAVDGLGLPLPDESQLRLLQTDIDKGKPVNTTFVLFKRLFNRSYEDDYEETMRRKIFEVNIEYIKDHNVMYAKGEHSYYLGVNQFADLTHDEFLHQYTGNLQTRSEPAYNASSYLLKSNVVFPSTVDWRDQGYVTGVKNQGRCGSCWAFSATGSLEGQQKRKSGTLVSLSEQQLVDCSRNYGNNGCQGGLMDRAFTYIKAVGGIEGEADYPYVAKDQSTCKFIKSQAKATVSGYVDLPKFSETSLQQAVATVGPVSVTIDASKQSFKFYKAGIYNEPSCSNIILNHGVLAVGYGTSPSDYWLVKNSWGTSWGKLGYIQMSRNKNNQCGIATMASYPLV